MSMTTLMSSLSASLEGKLAAWLTAVAIGYILYSIGLAVYYLYFSKLAGFPGRKIAAATGWYEFYYDCLCSGTYIFEIEKMHKKYGLQPCREVL